MKKFKIENENKFPNKYIHIPNVEKQNYESWVKGRNLLNFPHPYRILLCSNQPGLGKTNIVKNILLRANPPFKKIFLFHCGEDNTREYDEIDYECINELPNPTDEMFETDDKKLLIIEDKNFKYMNKDDIRRLDRLYGFVSTHKYLSIICCAQSFFSVPNAIRHMSNVYFIWKMRDIDSLQTIGRRVGLLKEELLYLMKTYLKKPRDNLCLDLTYDSPAKIRLNGFHIIEQDFY